MESLTISIPATQEEIEAVVQVIDAELRLVEIKQKSLQAHKRALQELCSHPAKKKYDYEDVIVECTVCGKYLDH